MQNNIRNTNLRFNLEKDQQRKAGAMSVLENLSLQAALPMPYWKKASLY